MVSEVINQKGADNKPENSGIETLTRNTHAHLCLVPVCRLCARITYAGAGEVRVACVTFAAVWCCSIQATMAPLRRRPRPPSPKNAVVRDLSESSVSECVRLCDAHLAQTATSGQI